MTVDCGPVFAQHFGAKAQNLDEPVKEYLLEILSAQTDHETSTAEDRVINTLAMFLHNCNVFKEESEAIESVTALMQLLHKKKIIPEAKEQSNTLAAPVQLGKLYERSMRETQQLGVATSFTQGLVDVNTNEDLNWEEKRQQAKLERKRKKEEEKKQALLDEFDDYLAQRGITSSQQAVKIHHTEGIKGSQDIRCTNIHINMGKLVLLDGTDLIITSGKRFGLVGRNGVGKTTLLRYLADGELEGVSPYLQILHIEQEYAGDDRTVLEAVLDTDVERTTLLKEEVELLEGTGMNPDEVGKRLAEVYERLEEIDAHGAEAKACSILHGLSFDQDMLKMKTSQLSGGWRMRVSLARALYISPDVLLLDEPTNHLDLHALVWLEHTLINWNKTLVVVSHSRTFLNAVCTDIIHYSDKKLTYYKGDYDMFEKTRYEKLKNLERSREAQEKHRAHMQAFVDRWRYNAKKATMAQSRLKAIQKLEFIPAVAEDPSFQFKIPEPEPCAPPYIQVIDVTFGYRKDKILFHDVNLGIDNDSRIALVGANGSGKSTFMNVIAEDLDPIEGRIVKNGKCRIARFTQHHVDTLTLQGTAIEEMQKRFPKADPAQLRSHLGSMGLGGEKALQPIYTLSGGQKSRIAFAILTFIKPHLLLLDEPTNHLDIDTVDALIDAINCYKGGILLISHDEHLINSVVDEIWVCGDGELNKYEGTFREYKKGLVKLMNKK
eukprot:TRINITY_DN84557_c0_g1_i1.p1 TRINITY_DN84557_c0_g1~~TRINITY_DN84557_c0_g1_i1.p1  ORF type:complete len:728 (+),score=117.92 TRINITY_DN84557_c0_g1_i1:30-2186(+)